MPDISLASAAVTWTVANQINGANASGANGYVEFEASAVAVFHGGLTVLPSPQRAEVVDGDMTTIDLPINDPDVWNWRVTPRLGVVWPSFHVNVPEGGVDLSSAAITPGTGPVRVLQGPQGGSVVGAEDQGDGTIRFVLDDGTRTAAMPITRGPAGPANKIEIGSVLGGEAPHASLTGSAPNQQLNLVLPKGDPGAPGNPEDLNDATPSRRGLMAATDKATLNTYRIGPENLFAGDGAGAAGDESATMESAGSSGGYEVVLLGPMAGAENTRGWKNTAVGSAAMRDNIDGYFNTALGNSAMERNVGGVGDAPKSDDDPGARNTAVGSNALRYNETGRGNTAVGRNSAHSSLSGSYITAIGTNAYSGTVDGDINSSKTADYVTAVGYGAAFFTDAPDSTAVGVRALYRSAQAESYGGTAIGNRALENSEARENTALGNKAGQFVTTGRFNLAVGPRALGALSAGVTGNSNLAVGTASMQNVTSGAYNVAIGQEALDPIKTGTFNTAIGHQATMSAAEGTTGATAIGANSNASHTNAVAIGRNTSTTAGDQFAIGRRHLEVGKAYGAPAAPTSGVRMWAEGDGAATVLKVIFPGGRVETIA